jgi:hypothetical protein
VLTLGSGHEAEPHVGLLGGGGVPWPPGVMILAGESEHEQCSAAVDAPADPNVGASVEFAHDAFEDTGGQWASPETVENF